MLHQLMTAPCLLPELSANGNSVVTYKYTLYINNNRLNYTWELLKAAIRVAFHVDRVTSYTRFCHENIWFEITQQLRL